MALEQLGGNNRELVKSKEKDRVIEKLVEDKKESLEFVGRRLEETKKELDITNVNIRKVFFGFWGVNWWDS